ncbi:MAG: DNA/RNA non-specific endonuclease, partial [Limisphaerales bacterium]
MSSTRVASSVLVSVVLLFYTAFNASAIIDATLQMQLGNPSGATTDPNNHSHYLIQRTVEAIDYSDSNGEPNWSSWDLTAADIGSSGRSSSFFTDSTLPSGFYHVTSSDYTSSGYDRGHNCPSADRTDNTTDNDLVFYMSNIMPQAPDNNQGPWEALETYCRTLAQSGNELLIICGPSLFSGSRIQPSGKAAIPGYTWKIIVVVPSGSGSAISRINSSTRVITVKMPNVQGIRSVNWTNYNTTPNQIQADTGYTFFTALDPTLAATLRAKNDAGGSAPPTPTITSFSPTSGPVGQSVTVSGTGFTGASFVRFNGTDATSFTVNSDTQITATVATGSSTGPISVTTGGGVATSSGSFTVSGGTPAPSITNFTPTSGSAGATVTINGSAFTGATTVAFNGTGANFTVSSDTQISATVPSSATSGTISVTTPAGTGTSSGTFTVSGTGAGKVVISQVYGGGGNSGATYKNDFIELYNSGSASVDLSTYAVQYTSAAGSTWQATTLSGSIAAGHYYLVQEAAGTGGTTSLPTPDATGTISMSGTAGKVALTKTTTVLTIDNPVGTANVVDFIGYGTADAFEGSGAAPAPSNTSSDLRAGNGATDTDNNSADFATGTVNPRKSATGGTPAPSISSFSPTSGPTGTSVTINGANLSGAT